ncbi:hypothetical protein [Pyramidobacter sp. C12-8]|uniref:hypothetical protein n=1 Tax=Pyramidobacter sp. C12-8 TaxID=1943580 RepID=UPI00098EACBC|nr:hypothetical protein [Pyramidobacter sp. C12-8]OON89640.1 hypothetical protein B0D78_02035 [Pyramidobacter sp. C12-8]
MTLDEKIGIFEERPAQVRAFQTAKDRYIGNSHGVELAKAGDWIVIDSDDEIRHFTPAEFMERYKTAEANPFYVIGDPDYYEMRVDKNGQILSIRGASHTPA